MGEKWKRVVIDAVVHQRPPFLSEKAIFGVLTLEPKKGTVGEGLWPS